MKYIRIVLLIVLNLGFAVALYAQNSTPLAAAKSFYKYHRTHSTAFTKANIDARKRWFSEALYGLFLNELKREKAYLKSHPGDKPFFGEGLPFQPWDEVCTAARRKLHKQPGFKADAGDADVATVRVTFAFPSPCKTPDANEYKLEMVRSGAAWVIDNVVYDDGSNLVKDLNRKEY